MLTGSYLFVTDLTVAAIPPCGIFDSGGTRVRGSISSFTFRYPALQRHPCRIYFASPFLWAMLEKGGRGGMISWLLVVASGRR